MQLELAGGRYKYAALTDRALRQFLTQNAVKFYQRLNRILDDPAAFKYDYKLVSRLRRVRGPRTGKRSQHREPSAIPRQRAPDDPELPVAEGTKHTRHTTAPTRRRARGVGTTKRDRAQIQPPA